MRSLSPAEFGDELRMNKKFRRLLSTVTSWSSEAEASSGIADASLRVRSSHVRVCLRALCELEKPKARFC